MIPFAFADLARAAGKNPDDLPEGLGSRTLTGVSTDTRKVKKGDVFFGIRGDRFDGSDFAADAVKAGASLAVVNVASGISQNHTMPLLRVSDTTKALGDAARAYRARFSGMVAAVTGTNGKTTVKEMLVKVLSSRFSVHGTSGNLNNQIGLPLSVFGLDVTHERAVFEMGMSASGEIAYLADIARPEVGVILNVGAGHMEFFKDLDAVADAKTELLRALPSGGTAVMNADDPLLQARAGEARCRVMGFGIDHACEFRGEDIVFGSDGTAVFRVEGRTVRLGVPGMHSVRNALAAYAAGRVLGVPGEDAAQALSAFSAPKMRMEIMERDGLRIINDAYNANPLSMRAAADTLAVMRKDRPGRLIAALGDMRELGDIAVGAHREVGRLFGALGPAALLLVGEHAVDYRDGALEAGMGEESVKTFKTAPDAAGYLYSIVRAGDTVFVKGSRALGMERLAATQDGKV